MTRESEVYSRLRDQERERVLRLGARLRHARQRRKWTQQILSDKTGISVGTIKKMEAGQPNIPLAFWLQALDVFRLSHEVDTLLLPENDVVGSALEAANTKEPKRIRTRDIKEFDFEP